MPILVAAVLLWPGMAGALHAESAGTEPLIEVRSRPLRQLVANIMGIARQTNPGMQTEMVPMLFLGPWGYPQFPDFDPAAPIVLCGFPDSMQPGGIRWMGLAKVREGSNPVNVLLAQGWTTEVVDGWTLFYMVPPTAAELKAVLARDDGPVTGDITWTIRPNASTLARLREFVIPAMSAGMGDSDPDQAQVAAQLLEIFVDMLEGAESFTLGMDTSSGDVSVSLQIRPRQDTLLDDLLRRPLSTAADGSQAIEGDALMVYRGRLPQGACLSFAEWLLEVGPGLPVVAEALAGVSRENLIDLASRFDGTGAGTASFDNDGTPTNVVKVYVADFTMDDLAFWSEWQQDWVSRWARWAESRQQYVNIVQEFTEGEIDGQPYFRFETIASQRMLAVKRDDLLAAMEALNSGRTDPEALAAFGKVQELKQSVVMYSTAVDGWIVAADSDSEMLSIARRLAAGESVENNLADALPIGKSDWLVIRVDVGKLPFGEWLDEPTPSIERLIRQFRATKHSPMEIVVRNEDGALNVSLNVPVSSAAAVFRLMQELEKTAAAEGQQKVRIPF